MRRIRTPALLALLALAAGCARQAPLAADAANPGAPKPATHPVTVGEELGAAVDNRIVVDFANASDRLTPAADKQLDIAARLFRDVRPVSMFSIGYSDATGSELTNLILAARRANTVKAALVARGIPANQVLIRSYGQSDPIDKAHPDAAANRRVIVSWDIL